MIRITKRKIIHSLLLVLLLSILPTPSEGFPFTPTSSELQIGLLVPLSGPYKVFGEEVLAGVNLVDAPVSISVLDTRGDPITAIHHVKELVPNRKIIALLGPVLSITTIPAACIADCHEIPLISPTATESRITNIGKWIYRLNSAAESQALVIADYAHTQLEIDSLSILAPDDAYAQSVVATFSGKFKELGGEIITTQTYESELSDYRDALLQIKEDSIQAIFIPAYPEDILAIAPQLWYYQIIPDSIRILGISGWGDQMVLEESGRYMENVIFTEFKENVKFRDAFYAKYKREPTRFSRLGWNAMMLISKAVQEGVRNRRELRDWLEKNKEREIAPGVIISAERGMKLVKLYKIENGVKKEILP